MKGLFSLELLVKGAHYFCVAGQWLLLQNERTVQLELLVEGVHCFQSLWPNCSKMNGLFSLELLVKGAHCFCVAGQWLLLQNERTVQFGVAC